MKLSSLFNSGAATLRAMKPKSTGGDDGRLALRKKQRLIDGYVWSDNMLVARGCSVRDLSAVGALVDLWQDKKVTTMREAPIPRQVVLYIVPDQLEIDCDVTWRKDYSLGLRFNGKFRKASRLYGS